MTHSLPWKRLRGWCSCKGVVRLVDKRRVIMDMTGTPKEIGEWSMAFLNAHGNHAGSRLMVN